MNTIHQDLKEEFFNAPYSMAQDEKVKFFVPFLNRLTSYHANQCEAYKYILEATSQQLLFRDLNDLPFIPVRLFKLKDLKSIPHENVFKILTSSGTTGQAVSRIFLDKPNAALQSKVLGATLSAFIGKKRLQMIYFEADDVLKDRGKFSARAAAILGFSVYGKKHHYALNSNMELKYEETKALLENGAPVFGFGFTFIIWQYLCQYLEDRKLRLEAPAGSLLLHGGGWKKLVEQSVSNARFKETLRTLVGFENVHDYYGMVEQTGSIFMECEKGFMHASNFNDVIIRDPLTYKPCDVGEEGLLQVISLLPSSYPGHSLLTEDIGVLRGVDSCECGLHGKYFQVLGRMKSAEIRGCSDTRD